MKITYDLEFLPERRRPKDGEDLLALKAFLAGKYENMCIQYEDEALCKRRYDSLRAIRTAHQQQDVFDLYRRVTPLFEGDNLVASGVEMEALSVEDEGDGVSFHVYVYNVQPGFSPWCGCAWCCWSPLPWQAI